MRSEKTGYQLQLISAWGAVGLVILDNVLSYMLEYSAGTVNKPPAFVIVLPIVVWPCLGFLLLTSVVRFLLLCIRRSLGRRKLIFSVFSLLVAGSVCILNFPLSKVRPAGAQIFLKGFEKWVMNKVDTDMIQLWIKEADGKYWDEEITYDIREGFPEEFPDYLKDYNLQYVWFDRSEQDGSKVIILGWGGGMFHWNLVIGDPNMKMPTLMEEWYSDYDVEFRRILRPGVYVYSRG